MTGILASTSPSDAALQRGPPSASLLACAKLSSLNDILSACTQISMDIVEQKCCEGHTYVWQSYPCASKRAHWYLIKNGHDPLVSNIFSTCICTSPYELQPTPVSQKQHDYFMSEAFLRNRHFEQLEQEFFPPSILQEPCGQINAPKVFHRRLQLQLVLRLHCQPLYEYILTCEE